jgi:hypothetical protein
MTPTIFEMAERAGRKRHGQAVAKKEPKKPRSRRSPKARKARRRKSGRAASRGTR